MATSFGKNFAIFRPSSVVDHIGVDVRFDVCVVLQAFRRFTYATAHSPTLPSLYLRHSSFTSSSVALPTSQLILQPFIHFSYVTGSSLTLPGEPPLLISPTLITKFSQNIGADTDKNKALTDCHKCCSSFLSVIKSHSLKIPASVLEKVRAGSCLKLFLIYCNTVIFGLVISKNIYNIHSRRHEFFLQQNLKV